MRPPRSSRPGRGLTLPDQERCMDATAPAVVAAVPVLNTDQAAGWFTDSRGISRYNHTVCTIHVLTVT
jgi:hypothetical protein